jgi:uncharacterized protein (TIGR04255 family)
MSYKNPIINEIYCQFYYNHSVIQQEQYKIMDLMKPHFEETEIEPDLAIITPGNKMSVRIRLWKNEKKELLQIFGNRIAFNYLPHVEDGAEYKGWKYFCDNNIKYISLIEKEFSNITWNKVSLSYIDKIDDIDDKDFTLGKYINCNNDILPRILNDSKEASDCIIGRGNANIENNRQIKLALRINEKRLYNIRLETVFLVLIHENTDLNEILKELHFQGNELFEKIITDYVRQEIMGGTI